MSTIQDRSLQGPISVHHTPGSEASRNRKRTWAGEKFDWLDQVKADPKLKHGAFKVAYEIIQHANHDTLEAYPGVRRICDNIRMRKESVLAFIGQLVRRGHLEVTEKGRPGSGHSTHYRIVKKRSGCRTFCGCRERSGRRTFCGRKKGPESASERSGFCKKRSDVRNRTPSSTPNENPYRFRWRGSDGFFF